MTRGIIEPIEGLLSFNHLQKEKDEKFSHFISVVMLVYYNCLPL